MKPLILITGISGSGKSVAITQLEDLGYYCVDNLPLNLLYNFVQTAKAENLEKIAVAIDVRSSGDIASLPKIVNKMRQDGVSIHVIFLEARKDIIIKRYSESRRRHPLSQKLELHTGVLPSLEECIAYEKALLADLRQQEYVIDTSTLTPMLLRSKIKDMISADVGDILLTFESFAFKKGVPSSADLVFDVRCLPNPHYESSLRSLTGRDEPVAKWFSQFEVVKQYIDDTAHFIQRWLPYYRQDMRSYLTVAIGCTGGQHRSVYVAEQLAQRFKDHKPLHIRHLAQNF